MTLAMTFIDLIVRQSRVRDYHRIGRHRQGAKRPGRGNPVKIRHRDIKNYN